MGKMPPGLLRGNDWEDSMLRLFARALLAWLVLTAPLAAQDWPTKTVRFIVPFGRRRDAGHRSRG